jgi:hypothetical protein
MIRSLVVSFGSVFRIILEGPLALEIATFSEGPMRSTRHYDRQYRTAFLAGLVLAVLLHATIALAYRLPAGPAGPVAPMTGTAPTHVDRGAPMRMIALRAHEEIRLTEQVRFTAPAPLHAILLDMEGPGIPPLDGTGLEIAMPPLPQSARFVEAADPQKDFARYVGLTPGMISPRLVNAAELQAFLRAAYDGYLHRYSPEPNFAVYFWIDEEGRAQRSEVVGPGKTHPALAELAGRLSDVARFTPARDRGRPIAIKAYVPILLVGEQ